MTVVCSWDSCCVSLGRCFHLSFFVDVSVDSCHGGCCWLFVGILDCFFLFVAVVDGGVAVAVGRGYGYGMWVEAFVVQSPKLGQQNFLQECTLNVFDYEIIASFCTSQCCKQASLAVVDQHCQPW